MSGEAQLVTAIALAFFLFSVFGIATGVHRIAKALENLKK